MMQMFAAVPHCSSKAEHVEEAANQSARRRTCDTEGEGGTSGEEASVRRLSVKHSADDQLAFRPV